LRIIVHPRTINGAVEKPISSAPNKAAITTSRPITHNTQRKNNVNGDHAFLWETAKFDPSQNQNPFTS